MTCPLICSLCDVMPNSGCVILILGGEDSSSSMASHSFAPMRGPRIHSSKKGLFTTG